MAGAKRIDSLASKCCSVTRGADPDAWYVRLPLWVWGELGTCLHILALVDRSQPDLSRATDGRSDVACGGRREDTSLRLQRPQPGLSFSNAPSGLRGTPGVR